MLPKAVRAFYFFQHLEHEPDRFRVLSLLYDEPVERKIWEWERDNAEKLHEIRHAKDPEVYPERKEGTEDRV